MIHWIKKFDYGPDPTWFDFLLDWIWIKYQDLIKELGQVEVIHDSVQSDAFASLLSTHSMYQVLCGIPNWVF